MNADQDLASRVAQAFTRNELGIFTAKRVALARGEVPERYVRTVSIIEVE